VTDTRTQNYSYDLVPGATAYRVSRVVTAIVTILTIVVACSLGYLRVTASDDGHDAVTIAQLFWLIGPIVIDAVVGVVGFTFLGRRSKAESAAGYTTLTRGFATVDQVDPKTGVVIRRAGSVVLTEPSRSGEGEVSAPASDSLRFTGSKAPRSRVIVIGVAVVAAIGFAVFGSLSGSHGDLGISIVVVLGLILVVGIIVALSLGGVALYARGFVAPVRAARADTLVFLSQKTPELEDAAGGEVTLPKSRLFAVSIGTDGLELWGKRKAIDPIAVLPWSSITRIQPGRLMVSNGNNSSRAAALHVFRTSGAVELDFPLPIYGPNGLGFARVNYANTVLDAVARYARIA
jgi:hypothetical protein